LRELTVSPLTPKRWAAFEDLLGKGGASNGCWCMYWRVGPRYHDRPRTENKSARRQLADSRPPPGLLAFDGDIAVGWCELADRLAPGYTRNLFPGVASIFAERGFEVVVRRKPDRPVMREYLGPSSLAKALDHGPDRIGRRDLR